MLDDLDKKIIAAMQNDLPLVANPYELIAAELEISEGELLARLQKYRQQGQIRKMGAVLRHREVGFAANALCAWVVPAERQEEVGARLAASSAVTHCYTRMSAEGWPYNFYTMVHERTREDCEALVRRLAAECQLTEYIMLFSTREWKKTSMKYFSEVSENA